MKAKILRYLSYFLFFFALAPIFSGDLIGALGVGLLSCALNPRISELMREKLPPNITSVQFYSGSVVLAFLLVAAAGGGNSTTPAGRVDSSAPEDTQQVAQLSQPETEDDLEESLADNAVASITLPAASGARQRVYDLLLDYPAVGSQFEESTSPCWKKSAPQASIMNPGFYCSRQEFNPFDTSLSDDFEDENPNLEDPDVFQSFKFREDGTLNSMLYGMYNTFASADDAAQFILEAYGDLELKHDRLEEDSYREGTSLVIDISFSDPILEWNERQLSFGCDAYPYSANPMIGLPIGDPRQKEWKDMFSEVMGHPGLNDITLMNFTDFQINKNSVDRSGESRCVLATIFYGDRKVTTLGEDPRKVIEVVVAEIDPRFELTDWD